MPAEDRLNKPNSKWGTFWVHPMWGRRRRRSEASGAVLPPYWCSKCLSTRFYWKFPNILKLERLKCISPVLSEHLFSGIDIKLSHPLVITSLFLLLWRPLPEANCCKYFRPLRYYPCVVLDMQWTGCAVFHFVLQEASSLNCGRSRFPL